MKIVVVGAGAVGGYFGARLAQAGHDVTFLARGDHARTMQHAGLTVKSIQGDFKIHPVKVTDSLAAASLADLVIVAVKAWQVREIAPSLVNITNRETTILPLQNGVLAADELKEHLDEKCIIGGVCRIISKIESPGVINHFGLEPLIECGELDNAKTERISRIKTTLENAQIRTIISDNITTSLWKKFIHICVSGLLAVSKTTYGELRELKETRFLMIELLTEIFNLAQKIGVPIPTDYVDQAAAFIDSFPYASTSSLTRDVWEGKPSEIEYQNGTVVKLGNKYGVATPVNNFVHSCILPMEKKARSR